MPTMPNVDKAPFDAFDKAVKGIQKAQDAHAEELEAERKAPITALETRVSELEETVATLEGAVATLEDAVAPPPEKPSLLKTFAKVCVLMGVGAAAYAAYEHRDTLQDMACKGLQSKTAQQISAEAAQGAQELFHCPGYER